MIEVRRTNAIVKPEELGRRAQLDYHELGTNFHGLDSHGAIVRKNGHIGHILYINT